MRHLVLSPYTDPYKIDQRATRSQVKTILNRGTYLYQYGLHESFLGVSPLLLGRLFL